MVDQSASINRFPESDSESDGTGNSNSLVSAPQLNDRDQALDRVFNPAIAYPPATVMSDSSTPFPESTDEATGLEPELGGYLRENENRTGFEPELGGAIRQNGVYVDEVSCIGCTHCSHVARNTFYIESDHGRARVFQQDGDSESMIQEAIDTCPVDCIHWVDYTELKQLEKRRKYQVIKPLGFIQEYSTSPLRQQKS